MHRRRIAHLTVAGLLLLGITGSVWAHPRARRHHHGHRHTKAVIVVGQPRAVKHVVVLNGVAHGTLDLNVKPKSTELWVDGNLRGTVGAFDGYPSKLHLRPGVHSIKLVTPDGEVVARDVRVQSGVEMNVGLDLR